jgi:hypothetical protein
MIAAVNTYALRLRTGHIAAPGLKSSRCQTLAILPAWRRDRITAAPPAAETAEAPVGHLPDGV